MRRAILVSVLAALVLSPVAWADHLPGFRESVRLSPRASSIVGHPVKVFCTGSRELWADTAIGEGGPAGAWGIAYKDRREMYLAPGVCQSLERWVRGKPVTLRDLAHGIHALIHESLHLRGVGDEGEAECGAVREASRWARSLFGVKKPVTLREVVAFVRADAAC